VVDRDEGTPVSRPIAVTLPDEVLRQAETWAGRTGRPVADFLAEALKLSLQPLGVAVPAVPPAAWTDAEVLAAVDAEMTSAEDGRLSELLDRQQAAELSGEERVELAGLMQVYQDALLRKAQALAEAVRRGLREPLGP
jgi:hypothetical protein